MNTLEKLQRVSRSRRFDEEKIERMVQTYGGGDFDRAVKSYVEWANKRSTWSGVGVELAAVRFGLSGDAVTKICESVVDVVAPYVSTEDEYRPLGIDCHGNEVYRGSQVRYVNPQHGDWRHSELVVERPDYNGSGYAIMSFTVVSPALRNEYRYGDEVTLSLRSLELI